MRIALWLVMLLFISTLFWPILLSAQLLLLCAVVAVLLLLIPQLRILAVIPIAAIYFTLYTNLTLTGQFYPLQKAENKSTLQQAIDGKDHSIIVKINSLISENNRGYFTAKLIELDGDHLNFPPLIEMRWYRPEFSVQAGQIHHFKVRFTPVYGRGNPAGFDRQKWSYAKHVAYKASIKEHLFTVNETLTIRAYFYEKVKQISSGLQQQGIILALTFADKSLISLDRKSLIRALGISHLFAISGLHIGLFFSFVFIISQISINHLLSVSKMGWYSVRLINIVALLGAWFYAYLAGFSLPTQRAFLMLFIAVVIFSMKRKCAKKDLLSLVLFVVLIWDPLAVLSVSLWLSFSAVAIIVFLLWAFPSVSFAPLNNVKHPKYMQVRGYWQVLLFLQLGLTFLMLPVQLMSFSGLSPVALFVNLLAVPLFSLFVIPVVLLASIITLIYPPLALLLFNLSDQTITLFFQSVHFITDYYQLYALATEKLLIILLSLVILLIIVYFHASHLRKNSYLFCFILSGLLLLSFFQNKGSKQTWFIEAIDVGQGLSVLIRSEGKVLLYDTGARYPSGFNMAESEITPYLISLGITELEYLIISHSDNDHAGGADIIAGNFPVAHYFSGEPLQSQYEFTPCRAGTVWRLGILTIDVLAPVVIGKNNNNNSCVLRVSDGKTSLLLTGDIEKKQEKILMSKFSKGLQSDILFAPHHGSRHSSSHQFIEIVKPKWVVFSAGFLNRWGFPAPEVIQRYDAQSVNMLNSGLSGLIRFQITPQAINIKTFREDLAPYWYHRSFPTK